MDELTDSVAVTEHSTCASTGELCQSESHANPETEHSVDSIYTELKIRQNDVL